MVFPKKRHFGMYFGPVIVNEANRLWNDVHGEKIRTSDLFDATQILDPARTDMPPL